MGNGIFCHDSKGSLVTGNNVTHNEGCGIGFGYGPNGVIKGNYIAKYNIGIWISNAFENTVISNTVIENDGWGIRLEGSQQNNSIYHNNFIDNNNNDVQSSIAKLWVYPDLFKNLGPNRTPRPPQFVDGAANASDNGDEGNYWSDYTGEDSNDDGIGDTPYMIDGTRKDNYPLMSHFDISNATISDALPETPHTKVLPTVPVIAAAVIAAVVAGAGLLVYYKKRRR